MLNYKYILLFLFLYGCTDEKVAPNAQVAPQNKEYSLQDIDEIYRSKLADEKRKKRLEEHKNLGLYGKFYNRLVEKTTITKTLQQPKSDSSKPADDKPSEVSKVDNTTVQKQLIHDNKPATSLKVIQQTQARDEEAIYLPIIIAATAQQSAIERWGRIEKIPTKKNIRAGYRIDSNLAEAITSSDSSLAIFKVVSIDGEYHTYINVTISCNYRYNPSTQRMNFVCRNFESQKHQINISAEILDREGNKGLSGRVTRKKVDFVESATYAGLQGAVQAIGNINPVQAALQSGISAGIKKPQTITKEVLYVDPQPVIVHFLNSF